MASTNHESSRDPYVSSEHRGLEIRTNLERQMGRILNQVFNLFESGYLSNDQEMVHHLSERLFKGIARVKLLYVSSRCQECYRGHKFDIPTSAKAVHVLKA